jgi:trans-2,3-dihydro-3-hydroxyanthranilate isomerase
MRSLPFHWLDVFVPDDGGGDRLVVIEAADALEPDAMRAIAEAFGGGTTAFLLEPRDPTQSARLRAFTPIGERGVAGVPLVGAAALIAQLRAPELLGRHAVALMIENGDDLFACDVRKTRDGSVYAAAVAAIPPRPAAAAEPVTTLAAALSLNPDAIGFGAHFPTIGEATMRFLFAPVANGAALARARLREPQFTRLPDEVAGVCLYTSDVIDPVSAVDMRILWRDNGAATPRAPDDATIALAAIAAKFEQAEDGAHEFVIDRREASGRRARTTLSMSIAAGALVAVSTGGRVRRFGDGVLRL